jgi:hypothetical protein
MSGEKAPAAPARRRVAFGLAALVGGVSAVVTSLTTPAVEEQGRDKAVVRILDERGLVADPEGVLWLEQPPYGVVGSATGTTAVVVRAAPGPEEPNDIYLVAATVSPEGVLLRLGRAHNLTETTAVDEQRPVGAGTRFAFVEQPMLGDENPSRVRLIDLDGRDRKATEAWPKAERVQAALTRIQKTGRVEGIGRVAYAMEPPPDELSVSLQQAALVIAADDRTATIATTAPLDVPSWLTVEAATERRPGHIVNWAVDRVRSEIGDDAMQYVKAIAFSALDVVRSSQEDFTGDTGAEDIAADLGAETLDDATREIPVDPEIGFPPPPLEAWVTPALPGEGKWNSKAEDPFVRQHPGLPPTFITTFIRGDRRRKVTRVYIALWDPRLVQLDTMAGVAEPKSATGATGPGKIPREPKVLSRVAAGMNAGFQALHGEYGMMSDGVIYLPPKPYGATVAKLRDGSIAFGTWPKNPAVPGEILSYRQNMTVLVQDQKFNPYKRTWWGGTPPGWEDKTHTTRTGICLTKEGFVGYFYGADLSPKALAQGMIQARCSYGIALDMNAGHSGLEFYRVGPKDQLGDLGRPVRRDWEREGDVPGMDGWGFRARRLVRGMGLMHFPRYIKREGRDYFYLTLRYVLPGVPVAPLEGASAKDGDGAWMVKGLAQHGFPYAVATTEIALPSGARARVLKIDPRMLTIDEAEATKDDAGAAQIALVNTSGTGPLSLWATNDAFSIAEQPSVAPAARIASGAKLGGDGTRRAAIGVERDGGMLLYVEAVGEEPVPAKDLQAALAQLGSHEAIGLDAPLAIALGGDTSMAGEAVRLPEAEHVVLYRKSGPGSRRIFEDTPVVPFKEWYRLQSRRIRYFKKPKKKKKEDS